ncbi:MAG: tripartite tricarboxylate transporter permease [Candidatus Woesearchaeota archaeon]
MITAFLLGIAFGAIAGLVPGIHINLISSAILAGSAYLLGHFSATELGVFIVAMGITHAFVETVPSIFLGAPDDSTALIMLPGHKMLHEGLGYDAVRFATIGALGCLVSTLALFPVLLIIFPPIFRILKHFIGWLLLALVIILIAKEKQDWWKALIVFSLTGLLGFIVLKKMTLQQPLLPLLSGLFGASSLALSLFERTKIPVQIGRFARLDKKEGLKGIIGGLISGTLVTLFPGLGPGHAGTLATTIFRSTGRTYLVLIGGLHTADFLASITTLVAIGKARNGAIATLEQLMKVTAKDLWLFGITALIAGIIAAALALLCAKGFSEIVERINYPTLSLSVLVFLVILVALIAGWKAIIVLIVSSLIGLLAPWLKVSRAHAMGCLLVPTLTYYL